ncbi:MAG: hypothetical protein PHE56_05500 [Bacteroidales bacterium]|nr:hypothetical protein [Bacteroidales bacterium]
MKTKVFLSLIVIAMIAVSCGSKLKRQNDCYIEDSEQLIKNLEYEELVDILGEPDDKSPNLEEQQITVTWEINDLFKEGGKGYDNNTLSLKFEAYYNDVYKSVEPIGKPICGHMFKDYNGEIMGDLIW